MTTEQIAQSKMREINIHSSFVLKPSSQSSLERKKQAEERQNKKRKVVRELFQETESQSVGIKEKGKGKT